jgi:hypothetical protein
MRDASRGDMRPRPPAAAAPVTPDPSIGETRGKDRFLRGLTGFLHKSHGNRAERAAFRSRKFLPRENVPSDDPPRKRRPRCFTGNPIPQPPEQVLSAKRPRKALQVLSNILRVSARPPRPKTRAGLEAKACGKASPPRCCPARRGHYGACPTVSRESSCNLRTLYRPQSTVSMADACAWIASP